MDERIGARKQLYERYVRGLQGLGLGFQRLVATRYNYAYMPIVLPSNQLREKVYNDLLAKDIKARRYFYPLTSSFEYFPADTTRKAHVPVAASLADRVLCLPLFAELQSHEADLVIDGVRKSLR